MRKVIVLLCVALVLIGAVSCDLFGFNLSTKEENGQLIVSFASTTRGYGNNNADVSYYKIAVSQSNDSSKNVDAQLENGKTSHTFELSPGTWTVEVTAYNASDNAIGYGRTDNVSVRAGETVTASVSVFEISDQNGMLSVSIFATSSTDYILCVYDAAGVRTSNTPIDFVNVDNQYTGTRPSGSDGLVAFKTQVSLTPGYYSFKVFVKDPNIQNPEDNVLLGDEVNAFRIVANTNNSVLHGCFQITTLGSFAIVNNIKSLSVTNTLKSPYALKNGKIYADATSEFPSDANALEYSWYLDGNKIENQTSTSLEYQLSNATKGSHKLKVAVTDNTKYVWDAETSFDVFNDDEVISIISIAMQNFRDEHYDKALNTLEQIYIAAPDDDNAKAYSALAKLANISRNTSMTDFAKKYVGIMNLPTSLDDYVSCEWLKKQEYKSTYGDYLNTASFVKSNSYGSYVPLKIGASSDSYAVLFDNIPSHEVYQPYENSYASNLTAYYSYEGLTNPLSGKYLVPASEGENFVCFTSKDAYSAGLFNQNVYSVSSYISQKTKYSFTSASDGYYIRLKETTSNVEGAICFGNSAQDLYVKNGEYYQRACEFMSNWYSVLGRKYLIPASDNESFDYYCDSDLFFNHLSTNQIDFKKYTINYGIFTEASSYTSNWYSYIRARITTTSTTDSVPCLFEYYDVNGDWHRVSEIVNYQNKYYTPVLNGDFDCYISAGDYLENKLYLNLTHYSCHEEYYEPQKYSFVEGQNGTYNNGWYYVRAKKVSQDTPNSIPFDSNKFSVYQKVGDYYIYNYDGYQYSIDDNYQNSSNPLYGYNLQIVTDKNESFDCYVSADIFFNCWFENFNNYYYINSQTWENCPTKIKLFEMDTLPFVSADDGIDMILTGNLLYKNNSGFNQFFDELYAILFSENSDYKTAKQRINSMSDNSQIKFTASEIEAFGLDETFGSNNIVVSKQEFKIVSAAFQILQATLEYLRSMNLDYPFDELGFFDNDIVWTCDGHYLWQRIVSNISEYSEDLDPLANGFMATSDASLLQQSKENFTEAVNTVLTAYVKLMASSNIPQGIKDWFTESDSAIRDTLNSLKTALESTSSPSWCKMPGDTTSLNISKIFSSDAFALSNIFETTTYDNRTVPVFYICKYCSGYYSEWTTTTDICYLDKNGQIQTYTASDCIIDSKEDMEALVDNVYSNTTKASFNGYWLSDPNDCYSYYDIQLALSQNFCNSFIKIDGEDFGDISNRLGSFGFNLSETLAIFKFFYGGDYDPLDYRFE